MLLDAHVHIDHYGERLDEALAQIAAQRILTVCVAMDIPSYERTLEIVSGSSYLIPTFGIHPAKAHDYAQNLSALDPYLERTPLIGEAGLDFFWVEDKATYPLQMEVFRYQCQWAQRMSKPMNLHTKGAELEILQTLREFGLRDSLIHWYSGPPELIGEYLAQGCYFSLGVETLISPSIQAIARQIPLERILLESDNPGGYEWLTGQVGMPSILIDVLEKVAAIKGVSPPMFESKLDENWQAFSSEIKGLKVNGESES